IGHENRLIQTENSDRDQISDEEERFEKGESEGRKEHAQEDIEHPFLSVLGADLYDLLTVGNRRFFDAFQFDVGFNEFNSAVSPGGYRLDRSTGKPVNHCASGDKSQHE